MLNSCEPMREWSREYLIKWVSQVESEGEYQKEEACLEGERQEACLGGTEGGGMSGRV